MPDANSCASAATDTPTNQPDPTGPVSEGEAQADRDAKVNAIAADLLSMGNEPTLVAAMAAAAKSLLVGTRVRHITSPGIEGVVGSAITERLQVAITRPDNINGAFCFCDPRNLTRLVSPINSAPEQAAPNDAVREAAAWRWRVMDEEGEYSDWVVQVGEPGFVGIDKEPLFALAIPAQQASPQTDAVRAVMDALWPILGGSHTAASVWTEIDAAVSEALSAQPAPVEGVERLITVWRKTGDKFLEWDHYVSENADEACRAVENLQKQGVRQWSTYSLGKIIPVLSDAAIHPNTESGQ